VMLMKYLGEKKYVGEEFTECWCQLGEAIC